MRRLLFPSLTLVTLGLTCLVVACGGTVADPGAADAGEAPDAAEADAAVEVFDAGTPDTAIAYPANHTPLPVVDNLGGRIIAAPKLVTVTFAGDPLEQRLQEFGDVITTTPWWDAVRAGYCSRGQCIGKGSGGGHVVLNVTPDPSYTDTQARNGTSTIQSLIRARISDGTLPAPTPDTLYMLYFPDGVTISLSDGQGTTSNSCDNGGFGAYHQGMLVTPQGATVSVQTAYAIMPRCGPDEEITTVSAAHELIEAATDPDTNSGTAYYMKNQLWTLGLGGEVADLCVDFSGRADQFSATFKVPRSWSNLSAAAGHNPCVPLVDGDIYFNAAPVQDQIRMTPGQTLVVQVDAYSDAPLPSWGLSTRDLSQFQGAPSGLAVTFDKISVRNGSKVKMTLKMPSSGLPRKQALFNIVSTSATARHSWPFVVFQE